VAKPDLGTKRQCLSCGAKYYDLGKDPATCPRCGAVFQAPALARARTEAKQADDEETETELDAPEMISLEEADAEDAGKDPVIDDVEIEDDIDADDDFLTEEEDDEDDDVSTLIDGDLEDDEES
jgi:uncharacterized protein (TIGR02300 family)